MGSKGSMPHIVGGQRTQLGEMKGQKDLLICYRQRLISKQFESLC